MAESTEHGGAANGSPAGSANLLDRLSSLNDRKLVAIVFSVAFLIRLVVILHFWSVYGPFAARCTGEMALPFGVARGFSSYGSGDPSGYILRLIGYL